MERKRKKKKNPLHNMIALSEKNLLVSAKTSFYPFSILILFSCNIMSFL